MTIRISVVVPTFNEERKIENTVRTVHAFLASGYEPYEIIVADDGSTDATRQIVGRLCLEISPLRLLVERKNRGKGSAVRRGVAASTGRLVLVTDADLATPIGETQKLYERILAGADIAIGSRGLGESQIIVHQPLHREMLGRLFNLLVQATLLPGVWDTQCGFKLFRGPVARTLFAYSTIDGFAFDVEILGRAARAGCKIVEVPVRWSHVNQSRVRLGRDGAGMLWDLVRIIYRLRVRRYALPGSVPSETEAEPLLDPEKT